MVGYWGIVLVRFNTRYYIIRQQQDGFLARLGDSVVSMIPADEEEYREWLIMTRAEFASVELTLEQTIYHIRSGFEPARWQYDHLETLPSELPRLKDSDAEFFYVIDLDREVLTMQHGAHFKLNKVPRESNLWLYAICESVLLGDFTLCPETCPVEYMASLDLPLPPPSVIEFKHRSVKAKSDLTSPVKVFLTQVLAMTMIEYHDEILWFGREWKAESFPFREIAFALVSIASGTARYCRLPAFIEDEDQDQCLCCHPYRRSPGWFNNNWMGKTGPLLEFGAMAHQTGDPPGAAPRESIYWHEGVLVSLALKITGEVITYTVEAGLQNRPTGFQFIVMSLFEIAFGEVFLDMKGEPFVKISDSCYLSPVRPQDCLSTHPLERPVLMPDTEPGETRRRAHLSHRHVDTSPARLANKFPGLAALTNFFHVAADRRAAHSKKGSLPLELCERILDFVDYNTWRNCSKATSDLRRCCLRRFRIDERMKLGSGPFRKKLHPDSPQTSMCFDFEDAKTGRLVSMAQLKNLHAGGGRYTWRPVICNGHRRAIMMNVKVNYQPVSDRPFCNLQKPAEIDSDGETTTEAEDDNTE
ncbi:hypothetical protein CP533_2528 [Ophiocordyceps camponoti-saundersi (nom. inval.)]|nr:hypothetical protein CP533_2528 [Ophiocordyceps camponoti-saundersi (nom. inval.)]